MAAAIAEILDSKNETSSVEQESRAHARLSWISAELIVLALGAGLRLWHLDSRSLWLDEYTSIELAAKPLSAILSGQNFDFHTPPAYYVLLHFWLQLLAHTEYGLRLFSVLFDLFNIFLVAQLAALLFSRKEALLAALLYAAAPFAVYYGQEGRMYSLLVFEVLVSAVLCVRYIKGSSAFELIGLWAIGVLGCYTHYFYLLSLGSMALAVSALLYRDRRRFAQFAAVLAAVGLCFIPWLGVVASLAASGGQAFRRFVLSVLPYTLFRFGAGYGNMPLVAGVKDSLYRSVLENIWLIILYMAVFGSVCSYSLTLLVRASKERALLVLLPLLLPPVMALVVSLKAPMLSERYLIVSFPFFVILLVLPAAMQGRLALISCYAVFALTFFGTAQHHLNPAFGNADWRATAELISVKSEGRSIPVLVRPGYAAGVLSFYLRTKPIVPVRSGPESPGLGEEVSGGYDEFWLVESMSDSSASADLGARGFRQTLKKEFPFENGLAVSLFQSALSR